MDLHFTLEDAFRRCESVSSRQLQRAFGISRQAVWKRLRPLVVSGELEVEGTGHGVRYRPGPGSSERGASVRGRNAACFWAELGQQVEGFAYVAVKDAARGTRRADHALELVHGLEMKLFVILDFQGLDRVGPSFAAALLRQLGTFPGTRLQLINTSAEVIRALAQAERYAALRPTSMWGE